MDVSEHSGYKEFVWAIELNRLSLTIVGLWPRMDEEARNSFASDLRIIITFVVINFLVFIPLICSLVRVWGDITLMVDNLEFSLTLIAVMLKLIMMRWKRTVFASILKMMLEDWIESKADTEKIIMARQAQIGRIIMICIYIVTALGFVIALILPSFGLPCRHFTNLTDRNRMLPLQAYYFYDTDKSPQFELTLLSQIIGMMLSGIIYSSVDIFFGLCILHIRGQLQNYKYRLLNWNFYESFDRDLRKNVEGHRRLIRFARNIEDAFSGLILGLVFYFAIVFCLSTFLILNTIINNSITDVSISEQSLGLAGTTILFVHILLYCGGGEIIIHHCEAIYRVMYDLNWYKLESRQARSFMFLMMRAKEPFRITAGKVIPLTMATFCTLMKTSASYISVLLAMQA